MSRHYVIFQYTLICHQKKKYHSNWMICRHLVKKYIYISFPFFSPIRNSKNCEQLMKYTQNDPAQHSFCIFCPNSMKFTSNEHDDLFRILSFCRELNLKGEKLWEVGRVFFISVKRVRSFVRLYFTNALSVAFVRLCVHLSKIPAATRRGIQRNQ